MLRTVQAYGLIEKGDRILVAVSGGKDSYTLLDLLWEARKRSPVPFDLVAVHLDQRQPGYDGRPLEEWLAALGAPYEILHEDTYSIVRALTAEGGTYCAPCSRLRRGILYGAAERLGCNKIALGHHREDTLETLLMNLFYGGKLQAMPARYRTDDGRFQVIRPLIECAERDIAAHAARAGYPILPCNLCGSQSGLKREAMAQLLTTLEAQIPDVRAVMLNALKNVRPSHLLDPEVGQVWAARPPEIRPLPGRRLRVVE
jgi:tRNA 2-thiocytidine biosynthesis protein TtcA